MLAEYAGETVRDEDHVALAAASEPGVGMCTIVGIEGSFSRQKGAQLAVRPDGSTVGDLADTCLERQLASDIKASKGRQVVRYGRGSSTIDFRLPCGGGLDILLDPAPDRAEIREALETLRQRQPARIRYACDDYTLQRTYHPSLKVVAMGEGPEIEAVASLCEAMAIETEIVRKDDLTLGRMPDTLSYDAWTACLLLFHDHEWELALLEQALTSAAFYIGAQGGEMARADRHLALSARGLGEERIARLTSPVGLIPNCKSPRALALSAVSEIVAGYWQLRASP